MKRRQDTCLNLIEKPYDYEFLRQIVTTAEKWIYFRNPEKSGQWVDRGSRADPHPKQGQFEKRLFDFLELRRCLTLQSTPTWLNN